jgi:multidrug resistance efflux pump
MPASFSRSLRAIEGDGGKLARWIASGTLVFLAGWLLWMARAEVPLFAASTSARLVRERAVYPLQSEVDGRVVAVHAALEQPVEAGAILIELDGSAQELALAEERARLAALEGERRRRRARGGRGRGPRGVGGHAARGRARARRATAVEAVRRRGGRASDPARADG